MVRTQNKEGKSYGSEYEYISIALTLSFGTVRLGRQAAVLYFHFTRHYHVQCLNRVGESSSACVLGELNI